MARYQKHEPVKADDRPGMPWAQTNGEYIAGRAYLDEADMTAAHMEAKWGVGRLRLLVGPEMRNKIDRQRYLLNQAMWHGDLESIRREAQRMVKGWLALDKAADAAGATRLDPLVWEVALPDGTVAAIVPDADHYGAVQPDGRNVAVYTLEDIGRLLVGFPALAATKVAFPGSSVRVVRRTVDDTLDALRDSRAPLDDDLPF